MSGIYIPGMDMPTSCMLCSFCVPEADEANGEMCMVTGKLMPPCNHERLDDCPLVPVPEHGRLIDADALMEIIKAHDYPLRAHFNSTDNGMFTIGIQQAVDETPTIIPADKEGEG